MSQMKFVENAEKSVEDALYGFKCAYPALHVDPKTRIVLWNRISANKVCLLSGGGSGHEPFSIGFVGDGMLSGAVAGLIFTSPPSAYIFRAINALAQRNKNSGVLVIVMNYTGDVLNFGAAVEEAKAHNINVEIVLVDEDCAQTDDNVQGAGRRGMCGSCFVYKIAGGMAQDGGDLHSIKQECRNINESMRTIGVAGSSCTVPGVGLLFRMNTDEIDVGLGVHGEAGMYRTKMTSIDHLVQVMVTKIKSSMNLLPNDRVCIAINNLGTVSQLEMGIICNKVYNFLTDSNIIICRMYFGTLMTSLDMSGFQISLLNISRNLHWLKYLDRSTDAPGWPATCVSIPLPTSISKILLKNGDTFPKSKIGPRLSSKSALLFEKCLRSTLNILIRKENRINEFDSVTGDEKVGSALRRIADRVLQDLPTLDMEYPAACFYHLSQICHTIGDSSGVIYGIILTSCSKFLITASTINWLKMWKAALDTLLCYCRVKIGDKTLMDVLMPAYIEFENKVPDNNAFSAFEDAVNVAKIKCEETRQTDRRLVKTSTLTKESTNIDAEAYSVTLCLKMILKTIKNHLSCTESN